jgi:hypothetical protein
MSKAFREKALERLRSNSRSDLKSKTGAGFKIAQGRMTIYAEDWIDTLQTAYKPQLTFEFDESMAPVRDAKSYRAQLIKSMAKWIKHGPSRKWKGTIVKSTNDILVFDWEWIAEDQSNPDKKVSDHTREALNHYLDAILGTDYAERRKEAESRGIEYEHGSTREAKAKSDPKRFRGSSIEARVREAMDFANATKGIENKHVTQIMHDYLEDYFGLEMELNKNRSKKGFLDGFVIQGRMTFDSEKTANRMNPGNLDTAIKNHFEKLFGSKDKPSKTFEKVIENYIKRNGLKKEVADLFSDSDNPIDAMPKYGVDILLDSFEKTKNFKRTTKKLTKPDKKRGIRSETKDRKFKASRAKTKGRRSLGSRAIKNRPQMDNPLALIEILNAALPDEILERMNFPALVNRTGRFRNSAKVTNIIIGPRGGTEVEYTYMKDPYQTFEPGGRQGSTNRDPRKIIGQSVRKLAQEIMGKKFIKVRRI